MDLIFYIDFVEIEILQIPIGRKYHIGMSIDLYGEKNKIFIDKYKEELSKVIKIVEEKIGIKNIAGYSANITKNKIR